VYWLSWVFVFRSFRRFFFMIFFSLPHFLILILILILRV
jgi:hypothetical protein